MLIGSESERPYERPPLSKGYLLGSDQRDSVYVHPAGWYAEHNVGLIEGITVTEIDPATRTIVTTGPAGELDMSYDKLLLATGASPRRLNFPGSDREEVLYLRTIADYLTGSVRRSSRAPGSWWPGPAGSAWRPPRPPARPSAR